jgi:hypothetical protein
MTKGDIAKEVAKVRFSIKIDIYLMIILFFAGIILIAIASGKSYNWMIIAGVISLCRSTAIEIRLDKKHEYLNELLEKL